MSIARTVLIVDDSRISRLFLQDFILAKEPGWSILHAASGEEAISMVQAQQPDFVTMDLTMKGMSGFDAIAEIRKLSPQLRIVVFTANIQEAARQRAKALGVEFASKPISEASVYRAIDYFNGA